MFCYNAVLIESRSMPLLSKKIQYVVAHSLELLQQVACILTGCIMA